MKDFLETLVSWGPLGALLLAFIDGAGIPIPSGVDVLLVFLASRSPNDAYVLAILTTLGSACGNFILFSLARKGGQVFLDRHTLSWHGRRFRAWFQTYGLLTVFITALVPLPFMPMKIFVLCSGALGAPPLAFILTFLAARIPRYAGLAYLGASMGSNALTYLRQHVWELLIFATVLFAALLLLVKITGRWRKPYPSATEGNAEG